MAGKLRKLIIFGFTLIIAVLFYGMPFFHDMPFFHITALAAQEPEFRLDMDSLNLQKGVSSTIIVSLVNAKDAQVLEIEGLEDFDVLSQSQSTSTSIVGNKVTSQVDLYYTIMPKTTGEFTLKANIQYNGQSYETNELAVTVGEEAANENESARDLFVKTVLSQESAYLGEKVVVTYELYSRYSIENFGFTDYIAIDGIIAKDMPADQLKAEYVYLDGVRYAKYEVKQSILDPIQSGVYTIPSFNLQVNVITDNGPGGGLGSFFNFSESMYLQTEEKELTVKPLPSEGKPENFSGIVGELQIDGQYSREELNYGDSLSLRITASGNCNLDGLKNIFSGEIPGFTIYETQKNTMETVENNQYHVQKEFEAILVPEKTGVLEVAPVSISYFNPVTGKYEKMDIPGAAITVLGDMPQPESSAGGQTAAVETVRIEQVSYADTNDGYFTIQVKKQVLFGILIGVTVLIALGAVLVWLFFHRKKQDPTLKSLYRQLMSSRDINEIYNLFNAMIKHCYQLSLKASSQSTIQNRLPDAGLAARVMDIMDYIESANAHEEKGYINLKDKIRGVYSMIEKGCG